MSTPTTTPLPADLGLTPEEEADSQAVLERLMTGKPLDPEVCRRVRERAAKASQEVFDKHGLLNIGVPAIRGLREGDEGAD